MTNDGAYYEITIKSKTEAQSEEVPTESEGTIGGIPTRTLIIIVGVATVVVIIIFIVLKRR